MTPTEMTPAEQLIPDREMPVPLRRLSRTALAAAALLLPACSLMVTHPKPQAGWTQRTGQIKLASKDVNIVGDIVIRHDSENFLAEISKGAGLPMLKLSATFGVEPGIGRHMLMVRATGPLARGGWTVKPRRVTRGINPNAKINSRPWAALPEVFQWAESLAAGRSFDTRLPDVSKRADIAKGGVRRFEYRVHANPTNRVLTSAELGKLPALESVVCILDN
jgi:hypothetical protein